MGTFPVADLRGLGGSIMLLYNENGTKTIHVYGMLDMQQTIVDRSISQSGVHCMYAGVDPGGG